MSIYSSDYRERTRAMRADTDQRARETALNAAVALAQNDSTGFYSHNTDVRAQTTLRVAEQFLLFLAPPVDETPAPDMPGIPL